MNNSTGVHEKSSINVVYVNFESKELWVSFEIYRYFLDFGENNMLQWYTCSIYVLKLENI